MLLRYGCFLIALVLFGIGVALASWILLLGAALFLAGGVALCFKPRDTMSETPGPGDHWRKR